MTQTSADKFQDWANKIFVSRNFFFSGGGGAGVATKEVIDCLIGIS